MRSNGRSHSEALYQIALFHCRQTRCAIKISHSLSYLPTNIQAPSATHYTIQKNHNCDPLDGHRRKHCTKHSLFNSTTVHTRCAIKISPSSVELPTSSEHILETRVLSEMLHAIQVAWVRRDKLSMRKKHETEILCDLKMYSRVRGQDTDQTLLPQTLSTMPEIWNKITLFCEARMKQSHRKPRKSGSTKMKNSRSS
jgi:hypothetical protein